MQIAASQIVADGNVAVELVVSVTIPPADGDVFVATSLHADDGPTSPVSSASAGVGCPVPPLPADHVEISSTIPLFHVINPLPKKRRHHCLPRCQL